MKLLIALCFTAMLFAADSPKPKKSDETKAKARNTGETAD